MRGPGCRESWAATSPYLRGGGQGDPRTITDHDWPGDVPKLRRAIEPCAALGRAPEYESDAAVRKAIHEVINELGTGSWTK